MRDVTGDRRMVDERDDREGVDLLTLLDLPALRPEVTGPLGERCPRASSGTTRDRLNVRTTHHRAFMIRFAAMVPTLPLYVPMIGNYLLRVNSFHMLIIHQDRTKCKLSTPKVGILTI